jgi:DNA processing protein
MKDNETKYWIAFLSVPDVGHKTIAKLLRCFGTLKNAWLAAGKEYRKLKFTENFIERLNEHRPKINPDKEIETMLRHDISLVTFNDPLYPKLLKEISCPPAAIFCKGDLSKCDKPALAVVGSRKMTSYGAQAVKQIVEPLARQGISIISGLAFGVDAAAHSVCLENNGHTVAVLGGGLSEIYPRQNAKLAEKILESGGSIVSEYPTNMPAVREHFPARNRIIAGLANAALIIEAGEKSGALLTAYFSLDQNRDVFAVPGNINNPFSRGANNLIKKGAGLVSAPEDLFDALGINQPAGANKNFDIENLTTEQKLIYDSLTAGEKQINRLAKTANLPISSVNANLIIMETHGIVRNLGNGEYGISN